jgi:hypothetical protein
MIAEKHFGNLGVHMKIILKLTLKKDDGRLDCIKLAHDRVQWLAPVETAINFRFNKWRCPDDRSCTHL